MAVYTNLNEGQITDFLKLYDIGELISFSGITEGILEVLSRGRPCVYSGINFF